MICEVIPSALPIYMPLTKEEATKILGCKPRTLELYTQQGKLSVTYARGKRGRIAQYSEDEVRALKDQLESETIRPLLALQHQPANLAETIASSIALALIPVIHKPVDSPSVPIEAKPLLTLAECRSLTGLSRDILREAVRGRKLKAKIIGKGYRIKRVDLDSYVAKL